MEKHIDLEFKERITSQLETIIELGKRMKLDHKYEYEIVSNEFIKIRQVFSVVRSHDKYSYKWIQEMLESLIEKLENIKNRLIVHIKKEVFVTYKDTIEKMKEDTQILLVECKLTMEV